MTRLMLSPKIRKPFLLKFFAVAAVLLFLTEYKIFAHGGEDHSGDKTSIALTSKGIVTQTARVGDSEILLKYNSLEPDVAGAAQMFITRFVTNEPSDKFTPVVEIKGSDGKTYKVETSKSDLPGGFNLKLPSLPEGKYTIQTKIDSNGEGDAATFPDVNVEQGSDAARTVAGNGFSWTQSILSVLGATLILGLIVIAAIFALRHARGEKFRGETVSV